MYPLLAHSRGYRHQSCPSRNLWSLRRNVEGQGEVRHYANTQVTTAATHSSTTLPINGNKAMMWYGIAVWQ